MERKLSVAVIGGGKMGGDIAAVFAAHGWQVHVLEPAAAMRGSLPQRAAAALASLRATRAAAGRIRVHAELSALPWDDTALVVEAAPEKLALKQRLFRDIEKLAPRRTILTTNSSSLRLADVAAGVQHQERAAGVHWLTPAHVAPVVEVVRGKSTSALTIRTLNTWLANLGKIVVNLNRDVPGMIVNRVQHAMLREAFNLVDRGIATPEDIDIAVRYGFGFRYVACGPIRQRDLNGLVIHHAAAAQIYPTLHGGKTPARCLTRLVAQGRVGAIAGRGFYRWDGGALARELRDYEARLGAALQLMQNGRGKPARKRSR